MTEGIVASDIRHRVDLSRKRVAYVEHRLANLVDRHLHFRHIRLDDVLDLALDLFHLLLARVDGLLEAAFEQSLDISDDVFLVRKLNANFIEEKIAK